MKVLVTGTAGFLGPHVARVFNKKGHTVHCTDIRESVVDLPSAVADLASLEDMLRVTKGMDVVCHLGAVGDVYVAMESPQVAASANVVGTATLLEACKRNSVKKVVYASTWEVYGEPHYQPLDEKHPCDPDHPYGITKLAGERIVMAYDKFKGVPATALRLGTAYGAGMRPNAVFSIFIKRAMAKEPIQIQGSGLQTRQFIHTSDVASAFYMAALNDVHGEAFNVVGKEATSIRGLAESVVKELPTELTFGEARTGDIPPASVSIAKAEKVLGWTCKVKFKDGLHDLIEWQRSQHKAAV